MQCAMCNLQRAAPGSWEVATKREAAWPAAGENQTKRPRSVQTLREVDSWLGEEKGVTGTRGEQGRLPGKQPGINTKGLRLFLHASRLHFLVAAKILKRCDVTDYKTFDTSAKAAKSLTPVEAMLQTLKRCNVQPLATRRGSCSHENGHSQSQSFNWGLRSAVWVLFKFLDALDAALCVLRSKFWIHLFSRSAACK